tara:strand:+ start:298 stop:861 length:564 start_codon:yes stop_codon:yes gene_type:complete
MLPSTDIFAGREVVVTEKLDGENTSMYCDHYHARSLDSRHHPSRNPCKAIHGAIQHNIPEGWRVCGENVYAKHSIFYNDLTAYFYAFGVYNEQNECISWDDTEEVCEVLNLKTVPVLYRGIWDGDKVQACYTEESVFGGVQEGYVVRVADAFHYDTFKDNVAKMVRPNHVQTDKMWTVDWVPNLLRE